VYWDSEDECWDSWQRTYAGRISAWRLDSRRWIESYESKQ